LKEYQTWDSLPLILFNGDSTNFELRFAANTPYPVSTKNRDFLPTDNSKKNIVVSSSSESITLRSIGKEGKYIDYTYSLAPNSYQVDMDINMVGMEQELASSDVSLLWSFYSPTQEKSWKNEVYNTTIYYKYTNNDVDFFNGRASKDQNEDITTRVDWLAYKDQFFSSIIIGNEPFDGARMDIQKQAEKGAYTKRFSSTIGLQIAPNKPTGLSFYFGPNDIEYLKNEYGELGLHEIVAVGRSIIKWINQGVIINLFHWLNKYFSNYGIIILLMTIIIKVFLLPLTFRSYMSQAKMRVVKPMVDEATKNIPKDKAMEKQQATMAIYKKVGVSPLGGCLPMILQMPILFAMFRFFPGSLELRQESFLWATDLSTYDDLIHWGTSIPLLGNHLSLFTVLMTVTTIISMKTNSSAQMGDSGMPGMKTMMYIMPVTFLFVLNDFSAGLTYYYFLANVITFAQNFLFKRFINEEDVLKKLNAKKAKAKPQKKSKWQQRIQEMQKAQQQAAKKRK
jgi:YidC/Oxa1 family membrane protein insertase